MATLPKLVEHWPTAWRELFEERAAIMEHDGKLSREQAEIDAEFDIRKQAYGAKANAT